MDIKEIARKHSHEYLTFKLGSRKGLDVAEIVCDDEIYAEIVDELAQQFETLIESYKAELLKEAGEPVNFCSQYSLDRVAEYNNALVRIDSTFHEQSPVALYTSDQVAAAIIKGSEVK